MNQQAFPAGLDYEVIKTKDGEYQLWTPDPTGAILGIGPTVGAAMADAVKTCEDFVAEVQKGCWRSSKGLPCSQD